MGYWLVTEVKFVTNQTSYITGGGRTSAAFRTSPPSTAALLPRQRLCEMDLGSYVEL